MSQVLHGPRRFPPEAHNRRASMRIAALVNGFVSTVKIRASLVVLRRQPLGGLVTVRIACCSLCLLFFSANAFGQHLLWEVVEDFSGGTDLTRAITLSKKTVVLI